jgi:hypothetical protein
MVTLELLNWYWMEYRQAFTELTEAHRIYECPNIKYLTKYVNAQEVW